MSLVVPNDAEIAILTYIFNQALTLRLFSNNIIPAATDTVASYTEVVGGGYVAKALTFAHWVLTAGGPSVGQYDTQQDWLFTGPTNAPGTVYGYYVTRNSDGKLLWAERFAAGFLPFSPILGSHVKVTPRFTGDSVY
jgi:hypothetical protein